MPDNPLYTLSALEIAAMIRSGEISSESITHYFLQRIERASALNAFSFIDKVKTIAMARHADACMQRGEILSPLHGVPIAIKDSIGWEGAPIQAGSRALEGNYSACNSFAVDVLLQAGLVILGKTAMTEFAFGLSGQNPMMGSAKNPWDSAGQCAPGGSSSGAGTAVAAGLCPIALGGDSGGSVRAPAALQHLIGYKPSSGIIGRSHCIPLAESLDVLGTIGKTVADVSTLTGILCKTDPNDSAAQQNTVVPSALFDAASYSAPLRFAVVGEDLWPCPLTSDTKAVWQHSLEILRKKGLSHEAWEPPTGLSLRELGEENSILMAYEAYRDLFPRIENSQMLVWDIVRARIVNGKNITQERYQEALGKRQVAMEAFARSAAGYAGLIMPACDQGARPLDAADTDHVGLGFFLRPANFLAACAISLPMGLDRFAMPVGLQSMLPDQQDGMLLAGAATIEQLLAGTRKHPDLTPWNLQD